MGAPTTRRIFRLALLAVFVAGGTGLGCAPADAPEAPRLVLLYVPCTVSKSFLSPYDPSISYTPNLAAFASEGLVFERHQTEAGLSGIAYASIFSGGQAPTHGVYAHPQKLEQSVTLAAEVFADAGFETFYFEKHGMASTRLDYHQGVGEQRSYKERLVAGDEDFGRIVEKLASDPDYRAFVTTVFSVSHTPYRPNRLLEFCDAHPDECRLFPGETEEETARFVRMHVRNVHQLSYNFPETVERLGLSPDEVTGLATVVERLYKSRIHLLDEMFGAVVDVLREKDLLDESLVVFTSDHGETMLREGTPFPWIHGHALAPEVLAVPLIVRGPRQGVPTGRYEGVTRTSDLLPTLAALSQAPLPPGLPIEGRDLTAAIRGQAPPPRLLAFSRTAFVREAQVKDVASWALFRSLYPREDMGLVWVSVRDGDLVFKYRNMGDEVFGFEAFDLASDPRELRDLFDDANPEHRAMAERLRAYRDALTDDHLAREERGVDNIPIEEQAELLRSLGYIE